jgi:hypothetical protein
MATTVSSMIGVDLSGVGGSTSLFALGTPASGSLGSEWIYVEATATFVTGEIVLINQAGTAKTLISSLLTANADGYDIGFCQNVINQGEFGWVARRGKDLYVLVTGTLTAASDNGLALGANSGRLVAGSAGGNTLFGVVLTESVSASGVRSVAKCVLTWPRFQTTVYT